MRESQLRTTTITKRCRGGVARLDISRSGPRAVDSVVATRRAVQKPADETTAGTPASRPGFLGRLLVALERQLMCFETRAGDLQV